MASTMYARMATQIPYAVMYGIADKASTTAITAIMSEAMNTKPHGRIRGAMLGPIHSANRPDPPAHRVSFYLFNLLSKEACVRRNIDRPRCHTKTAEEISLNEAARGPRRHH
jgi:hypothetical protein